MNPHDPNISIVELVVAALGDLRNEVVLVGGCAVGLLMTDQARPPVRATKDVDLVIEVATKSGYYAFAEKLRDRGFKEDGGDVLCRWKHGHLIVDVMPSEEQILGFINKWYPLAIETSNQIRLPSGTVIRVAAAPLLIATKIEAFYDRGRGDFQQSHDIEDIINIVDGRQELVDEIVQAPEKVKDYLRSEIEAFLEDRFFTEALPGHFSPDASSQARVRIVIAQLRRISGL